MKPFNITALTQPTTNMVQKIDFQPFQVSFAPRTIGRTLLGRLRAWGTSQILPRNRVVAALFEILLGGLGIHKFYLGK